MDYSQSAGVGLVLAGRYRLIEPIGSGGMGRVWRAHDEVLHRTVAVKELTLGGYVSEADRTMLHQRTQTEARAAARITHPGVVTVHDVLYHDDRPWIVMQYVDGPSLADAARETGLIDGREAARIGLRVLAALRAAHAAGVLHRDVKPGNVLLARDGNILLSDFGIAAIEGDSTITRTGEIVGSLDYMAPERLRGSEPDPAADLWSLGATLYTAVQGYSPFRRNSPIATMQAVVTEEPPHPDRAGPLAPVIAALLSKDPASRPGAAEAERLLRDVLEGREVDATQAGVPTQGAANGYGLSGTGQLPPVDSSGSTGRTYAPAYATGPAHTKGPRNATGPTRATESTHAAGSVAPRGRVRGGRRTMLVALLVAVGVGATAVFAGLQYANGSDEGASGVRTTGLTPQSPGTQNDRSTVRRAPTDRASDARSVPAGWERINAPEGSLWVPKGWTRQTDSDQIEYSPDGGNHLLRISVDSTPDYPTPRAHLLHLEKLYRTLDGYQQIRFGTNNFRDEANAVLWEFTWIQKPEEGPAGPRRIIDQVYDSDDGGIEYGILMEGPADDWSQTQKQFDTVLRGWQPASHQG
ncbi:MULTISPECIES: serine/threonine-protein kinase [Streptomyces]|uniref:serine/threonine-protein kinase n=1 Tax=Streptomyces TaxID=1883 RepID=UPI0004C5C7E7|nr:MULTISPECIES: serine/threonine-protein kinase [Streptomyces]